MDTGTKVIKTNPLKQANFINRLFFWWTIPLFWKGAKKDLLVTDLYDPLTSNESKKLGDALQREWEVELKKRWVKEFTVGKDGNKKLKKNEMQPSLTRAILRTFWKPYMLYGWLLLLQYVVFRTAQPIMQGFVINYFTDNGSDGATTKVEVMLYATGLILITAGATFLMHHTNLGTQEMGMRVRVACCSLIYRKALRLSLSALNQTATGQVVNLLSNDVNRFDMLPLYLHQIWIMPIQVTLIGYVMWQSVGIATLIGIGSLAFLTIPIQGYLSKLSARLRAIIARKTDKRVHLMSELIAGIQVVKMYGWEEPFEKMVSWTRRTEIKIIKYSSYLRAFYLSIMVYTERLTLFLTLLAFMLMGNTLTAEVTFVLATYFNILQMTMAIMFPQAIITAGEALVSIKRLEEFLMLEEIDEINDNKELLSKQNGNNKQEKDMENKFTIAEKEISNPVTIELYRVSANWIPNQLPPTLHDISMKVEAGQLCALIGPVGSGKSSLLNVLLKELPIGAGNVWLSQNSTLKEARDTRGYHSDNPNLRISYCCQEPWLFGATIRNNILFGQPYDRKRYQEVTKVCALLQDFKQLPRGDMSIVGERGASLSGGQRARVNLARAVYRRADIYLFDDPLSAVDSRVGQHLFNECIINYLKGKTRILVTHQLQYLKQADTVVVLDRGVVKNQASFDELTKQNVDLINMLEKATDAEDLNEKTAEASTENIIEYRRSSEKAFHRRNSSRRSSAKSSRRSSTISQNIENYENNKEDEEEVATGIMSNKVYTDYFTASGSTCTLVVLFINLILSQIACSGTDYWITYWTNIESVRQKTKNQSVETITDTEYLSSVNDTILSFFSLTDETGFITRNNAIYVYTFCIACTIIFTLSRNFLFIRVCMIASRNLHNTMFANILQAPMQFFNTNPSGRILNRFSKDVGCMDELLPKAFIEAMQVFLIMIGIIAMVLIVNYWMTIPVIIIAGIFYVLRIYYLYTAQDIKRLEGITKSPVFSHVNASINGLTTIRSRGKDIENMLREEFDSYQDTHTGAWFLTLATSAAFGFYLDLIACAFVACVCFSFILMDNGDTFGGDVGLAISQSLILTGMLQYGVRQSTEVIAEMTSVERILQYTNLPKEGPMTTSNPPPPTWPSTGHLTLKGVYMRYNKDDLPVLKNLCLDIKDGWKVGIVGRTGAGKSSLISALFRLSDDGLEGEIRLDGIDIRSIGLHELRPCISIIPQEPVLFSESLRYNLDPFGQYPDAALWSALKEVELNEVSLDQQVTGGGSNFSVGQRQLICLARAILRNNRILVLDEATANIDIQTDTLIQRTIRTRFASCTVLTVAHRLNTIIDSDQVLVMDNGAMVEFGVPYLLLRDKPNGPFSQMLQQMGQTMVDNLYDLAETSYKQKQAEQLNHNTSERSTIARINTNNSNIEVSTHM